ncbi:MAG: DUF952 domain-containing protein [Ectothiorhodospiraceae bacterium]|nr:DUF952 domain-containing protein [Ectothiorhodospiraceae bacterium]
MTEVEWAKARADGAFDGSAVDHADGYIHLSTAAQVRETAARHFAGRDRLVIVGVDASLVPDDVLRWEPSRGGDLFPHVYAPLALAWVTRAESLALGPDGHRFPTWVPG